MSPAKSEGLVLLQRANDALEEIRLHAPAGVRVNSEEYWRLKRAMQEIDGHLIAKVQLIMGTSSTDRERARLLDSFMKTNRLFEFVGLALLEEALPMAADAPWPPPEWAEQDALAEYGGHS